MMSLPGSWSGVAIIDRAALEDGDWKVDLVLSMLDEEEELEVEGCIEGVLGASSTSTRCFYKSSQNDCGIMSDRQSER